jgi:two-component system OmpR family sensor kinase
VVEDIERAKAPGRIVLTLPEHAVISDLDPDALGILCRNLVENALRHGAENAPIEVTMDAQGTLTVANEGSVIPPEILTRLTARFERAGASADGSGLGLAIVAAIADRIGSQLVLKSPRSGRDTGFEASVAIPVTGPKGGRLC